MIKCQDIARVIIILNLIVIQDRPRHKIVTKVYLILALRSKDITTFLKRETHTLSSTAPHSLSAFYTVLKSIFPSHPVTAHSFTHHTFISLFKHTLNNTITCKIHTHPLTKVTHSNTGMHTVGCLSEAVAVGL